MAANRRNLQLVSKNASGSISNRAVVRATICGVNQTVEKFVQDSEYDGLERSDSIVSQELVKPPFDPLVLAQLPENSSELGKCVEAMEVNIEGFGGRIQSVLPKQLSQTLLGVGTEEDTDEQKQLRSEYMSEWFKLDSLFNNPNPDDNLTTLRRKVRKDLESTGNGYWEIVKPDALSSEISCINYVPSHCIRLGKLDKKEIIVTIKQLQPDFTIKSRVFRKRFRKFAQIVGINKLIWFKEWDDPRVMDKRTGEWLSLEEAAKLPKKFHATGLMWFKIHSSRTPYGIPRFIGNLFEVFGSRAASEINFITFKNNNIPSMAVLVSGGMLTDATVNRIEEFVNHNIKKSQNRSAFLILEADPGDDGLGNTGQVKVEIKPLTSEQHSDELFQNYDKNNREKIREAFRLPAIYVGRGDVKDSPDSRKLADEQIFSPERDEMDRRINQLVISMGIKYWRFKSNTPSVTDDNSLVNVLSSAERSGAMSPNLGREILSAILNKELPLYEPNEFFDPDIPMSISLMRLTSQLGGFPGGTNQTGRLAPNQGQVPRGADLNEEDTADDINIDKRRKLLAQFLKDVGHSSEVVEKCCGKTQKGERQAGETIDDCVSRKIPILIDEGMSQDQAVAVAHSMCSEEKSKGQKMLDVIDESMLQFLQDLSTALSKRAKGGK